MNHRLLTLVSEGEWIAEFIEIAIENIIPPFVEIKGDLNLSINVENGVEVIKDALLSTEKFMALKKMKKYR